ncbi:MAG: hypothetical protein M1820_004448 [Bogoriella megaspora]|nr:MAG: hypothetical protein M1820_004448 [Bogoriella megaspora]
MSAKKNHSKNRQQRRNAVQIRRQQHPNKQRTIHGSSTRQKSKSQNGQKKISGAPYPPSKGFKFLPKGDVYLTRRCTVRSEEFGLPAEIVFDTNGTTRLGLLVHHSIYYPVLQEAAETAAARAAAVSRKDAANLSKARDAVRDLYPTIPGKDLEAVLKRAWEKGSGNVGRTGTKEMEEKVKLAVEAHIRHSHTEYDGLLRMGMSREGARKKIRVDVRDVAESWKKME